MKTKAAILLIILCFFCVGVDSSKAGEKATNRLVGPTTDVDEKKWKTAAAVLSKFLKALETARENDIKELTTPEYFTLLYNFGSWDSYKGTWPSKFEIIEISQGNKSIILTVRGISPGSQKAVVDIFTIVQDTDQWKISNGGQAWTSAHLKHVFESAE